MNYREDLEFQLQQVTLAMQEVIEDIYNLNRREEILNKFIKEAINKIKSNQTNISERKLPPHSQKE